MNVENRQPWIRALPCTFPVDQGFGRRDGFALDSPHRQVAVSTGRLRGFGSIDIDWGRLMDREPLVHCGTPDDELTDELCKSA